MDNAGHLGSHLTAFLMRDLVDGGSRSDGAAAVAAAATAAAAVAAAAVAAWCAKKQRDTVQGLSGGEGLKDNVLGLEV